MGHRPINSIDTDGRLTIVIPGTYWSDQDWNSNNPLLAEARQHFDEKWITRLWRWRPSNDNDDNRVIAANALADYINHYHFAPGEGLYIVAHSHGGNVGLMAAPLIHHRINALITLGTPFGYARMSSNIDKWFNVTATGDDVQPAASKGCWTTMGCSYREGAYNLTVKAPSHSSLWQDQSVRNLWWQWYMEQQNGDNSNGSGGNSGAPPAGTKPWWKCFF